MRHLLMIIAFKCCCFHAAFTYTLLWNSYIRRRNTIWGLRDAEKAHLNRLCLRWTFLLSVIYCGDIFHLHWSLHPLLHLRTSRKNPSCCPFFAPPHFLSLSFPLSPYHIASHLWQGAGEQLPGPICISRTLFFALLPLFPSPHDSPSPPTLLPICALVCALRLFVHVRTETHPDLYLSPLSVEYTTWDGQLMIFALRLSPSVSLFLSLHVPVM